MYQISEILRQVEDLRGAIHTKIDQDGINFTDEVLELSEELDGLLNILQKDMNSK